MTSPLLMRWIVQLVAAIFAAYGVYVAFGLVHATFISPRAYGGSFWFDAFYLTSGVMASVLAFVLTPTSAQTTRGPALTAFALAVRTAAVVGFWIPSLTAAFRIIRRWLA